MEPHMQMLDLNVSLRTVGSERNLNSAKIENNESCLEANTHISKHAHLVAFSSTEDN